jgi:hypothetical protein
VADPQWRSSLPREYPAERLPDPSHKRGYPLLPSLQPKEIAAMNGLKRCLLLAAWAVFVSAGLTPADGQGVVVLGAGPLAIKANSDKSPLRVWVDQIGYRTDDRKLLIVASDQPIPKEIDLQVVNAKSEGTVWKLSDHPDALKIKNNGKKDAESGDYVAHLDLSDFNVPGRYYVKIAGASPPERSYLFNIGDHVYYASGIAAWKSLYFQRGDGPKPEKYAGPWNDTAAYWGPGQAKDTKVFHWEKNSWWDPVQGPMIDATGHDVSGSWWDAGNFDKYIGNTYICNMYLLPAIQMIGDAAKDGELNIPESGHGIPDLLSETKYSIEWFLRMADSSGAAYGRMYIPIDCPPSKSTKPCQLIEQSSGATMNRLAMLALAAVVWKDRKIEPEFAERCLSESLKAWKLLEEKPHPWPADPKDPKKAKYTGEWFFADYNWSRATAAACYFNLTGEEKWHDILKAAFQHVDGNTPDAQPAIWIYCRSKRADPALVKKLKDAMASAARNIANSVGPNRGYAAGIGSYGWGSNRPIGQAGYTCVLAAELSDDAAQKKLFLDAAEEFIHYLHGRNPIGLCYMTNYKQLGAEHSAMVMFHSWLGSPNQRGPKDFGSKFIGEGPGKVGPPPGYVVGGANGGMKRYRNDLEFGCWEFNEPCLSYQGPVTALISYFGYKVK